MTENIKTISINQRVAELLKSRLYDFPRKPFYEVPQNIIFCIQCKLRYRVSLRTYNVHTYDIRTVGSGLTPRFVVMKAIQEQAQPLKRKSYLALPLNRRHPPKARFRARRHSRFKRRRNTRRYVKDYPKVMLNRVEEKLPVSFRAGVDSFSGFVCVFILLWVACFVEKSE